MRIRFSDERRVEILRQLEGMFSQKFDEELSRFRAEQILDFFVKTLGPSVYNQAIQDARKFMADRLDDLDVTLYEDVDGLRPLRCPHLPEKDQQDRPCQ